MKSSKCSFLRLHNLFSYPCAHLLHSDAPFLRCQGDRVEDRWLATISPPCTRALRTEVNGRGGSLTRSAAASCRRSSRLRASLWTSLEIKHCSSHGRSHTKPYWYFLHATWIGLYSGDIRCARELCGERSFISNHSFICLKGLGRNITCP